MSEDGPSPRSLAQSSDLRLVPPTTVLWLSCWCAVSGIGWLLSGLTVAVIIAVVVAVLVRGSRWAPTLVAAVVLGASGLASGGVHQHGLAGSETARLAEQRAFVEVELLLTQDFRNSGSGARGVSWTVAQVREVTGRGARHRERVPIVVIARPDPALTDGVSMPVGSVVRASGRLEPADPGQNVAGVLRLRGPPTLGRAAPWTFVAIERVRSGLRAAVAHRPVQQRALVPALVLGDTSAMDTALREQFVRTGLTHLTAVSGANLSILLAFVLSVSQGLGLRGRGLRVLAIATVIVFVALCRSEPSVLRAAAMGLVTLAALGSGARGGKAVRHLCTAAIGLLLIDPTMSRSLSFALSVLACLGIVVFAGVWARGMAIWLPLWLAESIAVPMAAQVFTQPLIARISGQVSLASLPANMAAGPFVAPATVSGFAAAGLGLFWPWAAQLAGRVAALCAQGIIVTAQLGSALPGAAITWPPSVWALLILGVCTLTAALLVPWVLRRSVLALSVAVVLILALLHAPVQPGWPPKGWVVAFCDVGQGDAAIIRVGPRQGILVDAGPDPPSILRCLDQLDIAVLPLVVLTHFHADHVAGLSAATQSHPVQLVLTSALPEPAPEAARVAAVLEKEEIPARPAVLGEHFVVGDAELEVLGPVQTYPALGDQVGGADPDGSVVNDSSVVLRASLKGLTVLFPGDAEPDEQRQIVRAGSNLQADVLKFPHHGSARQDREFFARSGAVAAVASVGEDNDYGHPAPRALALARQLNMTVYRTDLAGSIALVRTSDGLEVVSQRQA